MPSQRFSQQKGAQRQKSLNLFKRAMGACGEDLPGILKTRYGKSITSHSNAKDSRVSRMEKLLQTLSKVYRLAPRNTKQQWLSMVQSCGFKRAELVNGFSWIISKGTWSRAKSQRFTPLPYSNFTKSHDSSFQSSFSFNSQSIEVSPEKMDVEEEYSSSPQQQKNTKKSHTKENSYPSLLPYLKDFFEQSSYPCPHNNKKSMPHSLNRLCLMYNKRTDKPCSLSLSCLRRIWKQSFKKLYTKTRHRDGLCQLCEIGHKLEKLEQNSSFFSENEKKKINEKKNIVIRHKLANQKIKEEYQYQVNNLNIGEAVLIMDFKENINLGSGPRELGQSWYERERRTIFGMALHKRNPDGVISKIHLNLVSDCLAHDAIFVKGALSHLFASGLWKSFKIHSLSIWSDNAPHFKNKILPAYLADLCNKKVFRQVNLCYFEAYHGKSEVDSMFGIMTNWITQWTKTGYLNTTEDLLNCFVENNKFLATGSQNIFYSLSFPQILWTESTHFAIKNIKVKNINFFSFNSNNSQFLTTYRLTFGETTGIITCTGFTTNSVGIKIQKLGPKKAPKYSKRLGVVNSAALTDSDEQYLMKKAGAWGLHYSK
jgi:hypothetical protein